MLYTYILKKDEYIPCIKLSLLLLLFIFALVHSACDGSECVVEPQFGHEIGS